MMYSEIVNPETGRKISVTSQLGKKILRKYLNGLTGGATAPTTIPDELYNADDPDILKTYMSEFIRHFRKKDHVCYFWAFKILELSNPPKNSKKRRKKPNQIYDPTDDLSVVGNISDIDTTILPPSKKKDIIYNDMGDISYHGPFGGTTTYHGFDIGDLKSCLQKYIRRGESAKAIRVILELDRLYLYERSIGKSCGLRTNMINRIRILACEDFADSNINMIELCDKYIKIWETNRNTNYIKGTKALVRIIKILEQTTKSRMISFIRATYKTAHDYPVITEKYRLIYDNIKTQTTDLTDSSTTLPKTKCSRRFRKTKCEYILWSFLLNHCSLSPSIKNIVHINLEWFRTSTQKEYWIYLLNSIKICMGETDYTTHASISDPDISDTYIEQLLLSHLTTPMILDDYCFDQHTKRGRKAARGHVYFSKIGSKVSNEDTSVVMLYKDIYQDIKILSDTGELPVAPIPTDHINQWENILSLNTHIGSVGKSARKTIKIRRKKTHKSATKSQEAIRSKTITELLEYYTITELTKEEHKIIIKFPQGQKLTSSSKKSVFIGKTHVYKGPFNLDGKKLLNNIRFTRALKLLEKISAIPPRNRSLLEFNIKHLAGYYYLVYKNIANISSDAHIDTITTRVISKSAASLATDLDETAPSEVVHIYPRGIINRISDIIKIHPSKFTDEIKIATLQHLYFRYLLNVGDSGVHNVLYREDGSVKLVAGVDMEEIRTKDQGATKITYLFNSPGFNKTVKLFKDYISRVTTISAESLLPIIDELKELGFDIESIKHKIVKFDSSPDSP